MTYGDLIRTMTNKQLAQFIYNTVQQDLTYFIEEGRMRTLEGWENFLNLNCEGFNGDKS